MRGAHEVEASGGFVDPREKPVRARDGDGEAERRAGKGVAAVQRLWKGEEEGDWRDDSLVTVFSRKYVARVSEL